MALLTRRKAFSAVAAGLGVTTAAYAYGDYNYRQLQAEAPIAGPNEIAEGIVVFTGSPGRIEEAFRLCGPNQKLLISGCGKGDNLQRIIQRHGISPDGAHIKAANITLDYAPTTIWNAEGTRRWLSSNPDISRFIVVTNSIHVPRSWENLRIALHDFPRRVEAKFHPIPETRLLSLAKNYLLERFKLARDGATNGFTALLEHHL